MTEHSCTGCTSFWAVDSTCMDCRVYQPYAKTFPTVFERCEYYTIPKQGINMTPYYRLETLAEKKPDVE